VLIGLACATTECLLAPYNDYVIRNIFLAGGHFPVGPFFVLTIFVLGVNVLLKRFYPASAFSAGELVTIWCLMLAPAGIPSSGMMRYALSPMVAYRYLATPENDWESLFHHYIPYWRSRKRAFTGSHYRPNVFWRLPSNRAMISEANCSESSALMPPVSAERMLVRYPCSSESKVSRFSIRSTIRGSR